MFTGIIEGVGQISRLDRVGDRIDLDIETPPGISEGVRLGDSVAVDGCCLTVTATGADGLSFQAIPETLRLTSLGTRRTGDRVNLERALRAGGRLDGHIVQGHIDATGTVTAIERAGDEVQMRVAVPFETARMLVHKGSVALDGVSLTVVEPDDAGFGVALIPHTLAVTTLGIRLAGDRVNVEVDVLGKYVFEYLRRREGAGSAGS